MSMIRFPLQPDPDAPLRAPRGAAAVGVLAEMPLPDQLAVKALRLWAEGEEGRITVAHDLTRSLGDRHGLAAVNALAHLVGLFRSHGRRPFMRHDPDCTCIGGDENVFAQMIAAATAEDTEDAMAFAMTLLPPALAYEAVQTARDLGLLLLSVARDARAFAPHARSQICH